jgi:hypothetical protein
MMFLSLGYRPAKCETPKLLNLVSVQSARRFMCDCPEFIHVGFSHSFDVMILQEHRQSNESLKVSHHCVYTGDTLLLLFDTATPTLANQVFYS